MTDLTFHSPESLAIELDVPTADVQVLVDQLIGIDGDATFADEARTCLTDEACETIADQINGDIVTERVIENYQPRPGQMDSRTFWIAYPSHVLAYGHQVDRISRATGRGDTRGEARRAAQS